jgi:probable HAF family extracellular repeat protein
MTVRREQEMNVLTHLIATAVLVVGSVSTAAYAETYSITDLGTLPAFAQSSAVDIRSGQVVGNADTTTSSTHAFSWTAQSGTVDLGTLGGADSLAYAVSGGQVVGAAETTDGDKHAFSWTPVNGMVDLGTLPGYTQSFALAVSDGQVVGVVEADAEQPSDEPRAVGHERPEPRGESERPASRAFI